MFRALEVRDFRLLWVSNLAASFAMQMQIIARGWLIYDMTESPIALTWVMLSFMLPSALFSLVGGVIADRMRKKAIMISAQLLNTGATFLLAWIIFTGNVTFWDFIYFGVFNGTVLSLSMPARASIIPELVPREGVVNAMALQSATFNLSRIAGPAMAGVFIAWFGAGDTSSARGVGIVFFAIGALYITSVGCTALLNYRGEPMARTGSRPWQDVVEGFTYLRNERLILGLVLMGLIPMTFGFAPSMFMPAFNQDVIGGTAETLGYLNSAMGVGALVGALALARYGDVGRKGRVLFWAAYGWGAAVLAFALSNNLAVAMFVGLFSGAFGSIMGSLNMSVMTLAIRPEIRGRIMAINMMTHGLMPLGMIPLGALAEFYGIRTAFLASGALLIVTMAWIGAKYPELLQIDKGHEPIDDARPDDADDWSDEPDPAAGQKVRGETS